MPAGRPSVDDVLRKYGAKIERQVQDYDEKPAENYSQSYQQFRSEMSKTYTGYEKWCHTVGSFIKMKPSKEDEEKVKKHLESAHLDVEPWQAVGLGVTAFILLFFIGMLVSVSMLLINGTFPILFFMLCMVFGMFVFYIAQNYPERLALKWRLKASSQMVPALLYIVVYMRHTTNLEKAIAFAAEHLEPPLAMDFKKIFYDVEVRKYSTIKESLDAYLESWRDYSTEFIEGFHLIESSLFEPDQGRRISTLEKALQVVLDGVYDKMLKFSHNVKAPMTNVYMLGVVMPTLGLALIPLASAMVQGMIGTIHIFLLFNLIVPFLVFFLTDKILVMRPGGHGDTSLLEKNPLYYKFKSKEPYRKAFMIVLPLFLISMVPLLYQFPFFYESLGLQPDYTFAELGLGMLGGEENFFGYITTDTGVTKGPFGLGAVLMGLFCPISIALFFGIAYGEKTKAMMIERQNTKDLEKEFNNSLFQLGNRLGNGVPPELVFAKVAESAKGLKTGDFFGKVNYNIQSQGMSVEKAIFDNERGALKNYPSNLIATSMRVLVESAKKGLKIAAISLMSISEYVKNLNKITMRLKDLLAEVTGDMKSNMSFLAPLLSGIVVGLASMITLILGKLKLDSLADAGGAGMGSMSSLMTIFDYQSMIPPYFLQISVGIYLIQVIFILTGALVTIDAGEDKLAQASMAGDYLKKGITLFFITALLSTIVLSVLGSQVLGNMF
jgi:hypothetical protein